MWENSVTGTPRRVGAASLNPLSQAPNLMFGYLDSKIPKLQGIFQSFANKNKNASKAYDFRG
jgi:hypothetical protein